MTTTPPPLVSVVVAAYNSEAFLATTLDSILAQTRPDFELIVVDDGSTDGTCALVAARYPQVRLIRQANQGVCVARNRGLAESRGQWICFVDHDDHWYPDKLALQLAVAAADPTLGVVYSEFTRWFADDAGGAHPDPATLPRDAATTALDADYSGWIYHQLLLDCWVLTSTAMLRRDLLDEVGAFDPAWPYAEDWELWLRLSRRCRFAKLVVSTVAYRQHREQGSRHFREIDYRTTLLRGAVGRWGFASPDGRAVAPRLWHRQLAYYHASTGLQALRFERRPLARRAFWQAWRSDPARLKYLAYLALGSVGWKPRW